MFKRMTLASRTIILLSWTGAVFILVAWPFPEYIGTKVTLYDKAFHLVLFGVFAVLVEHLLIYFKKIKKSLVFMISFILGIAYSAFSEFLQEIVPGRTVSIYDFYAGSAGVIIFLVIIYVFTREKT